MREEIKWIHFTLVWLIGIIITTLVAFVSNQHFDDFPSFIIPVLVGGVANSINQMLNHETYQSERIKEMESINTDDSTFLRFPITICSGTRHSIDY